jgi:hypothetical protein
VQILDLSLSEGRAAHLPFFWPLLFPLEEPELPFCWLLLVALEELELPFCRLLLIALEEFDKLPLLEVPR